MMFNVEYKVRRVLQTPCCRRVFYTWMRENVEAPSESEAIDKISARPEVISVRII